ncbi:hypothetical protein GYA25_00635 [Candidatus Woesearchaeota archaeon]|nr:hypothetical protein [Candidatus Woesearchaeota archaeon]
MRLWSFDFKYLDRKGILAVWREALLAKKVLEGKTKGYKNHPQLIRFRNSKNPLKMINLYLYEIYKESLKRNYNFDSSKINLSNKKEFERFEKIPLTRNQLIFEFKHLLKKLKTRDKSQYNNLLKIKKINLNNLFYLVKGEIEPWEKIN